MNGPQANSVRAALLTPLGSAGITVVQVAGEGAAELVQRILRKGDGGTIRLGEKQGKVKHCYVVDTSGRRVDEVVVCLAAGGESKSKRTEVVDICCHGGVRPGQKVMEVLAEAGARAVVADELPGRGLAGLMEVTGQGCNSVAAEALSALCRARTKRVGVILLAQVEGGLTAELHRLLAEDASGGQLIQGVDRLLGTWSLGRRLLEPAKVVIVGLTNAGKSSLANLLAGQPGSIVASEAGTTRDWVTHQASLAGLPVVLIDTAGHRPPGESLEAEAIRRAVEQSRQADVQLLVLDGTGSQAQLPELTKGLKTVVAVNKADLEGWSCQVVPPDFRDVPCVKTSAVTGYGRQELTAALLETLGCEEIGQDGAVVFTERQRNCLERVVRAARGQDSHGARKHLGECLNG